MEGSSEWAWRICWGHVTSTDFVHWQHEPIVLQPTPGGLDAAGCWSGNTTVDEAGVPTILYTAVRCLPSPPPLVPSHAFWLILLHRHACCLPRPCALSPPVVSCRPCCPAQQYLREAPLLSARLHSGAGLLLLLAEAVAVLQQGPACPLLLHWLSRQQLGTLARLRWRSCSLKTELPVCRLRKDLDANLLAAQADDLGLEMIEAQCAARAAPGAAWPGHPRHALCRSLHCRARLGGCKLLPPGTQLAGVHVARIRLPQGCPAPSTKTAHVSSAPAGDARLQGWEKLQEPAIAGPPPGMQLTGFRDPFVIQRGQDGQPWQLIIGSGVKGRGGTILLYQSAHAASGAPCTLPMTRRRRCRPFTCQELHSRTPCL